MIFTDRTITVRKGESRIDEPIVVYRGDYELEVRFTILNSRFKFMSGTNMIESEKASYGQLAILTPYGGNIFSDVVRCNDGGVTFVLTAEMLNQIEEVGLYSFQIRLMDYNKESRVSIPPIEFGIEVREPIASEDHDNSVNNAIVGYSIAKVVDPKEENVSDTFDDNGNYNKTAWKTGDRISQGKLNKIEDAIDKVNKNEMNNSASLSKRIDNNFNVLDVTKADKNEIFTMANMGQDIKEAMTGGSVAVVGDNCIMENNIIDEQVTDRKIRSVSLNKIVIDNDIPYDLSNITGSGITEIENGVNISQNPGSNITITIPLSELESGQYEFSFDYISNNNVSAMASYWLVYTSSISEEYLVFSPTTSNKTFSRTFYKDNSMSQIIYRILCSNLNVDLDITNVKIEGLEQGLLQDELYTIKDDIRELNNVYNEINEKTYMADEINVDPEYIPYDLSNITGSGITEIENGVNISQNPGSNITITIPLSELESGQYEFSFDYISNNNVSAMASYWLVYTSSISEEYLVFSPTTSNKTFSRTFYKDNSMSQIIYRILCSNLNVDLDITNVMLSNIEEKTVQDELNTIKEDIQELNYICDELSDAFDVSNYTILEVDHSFSSDTIGYGVNKFSSLLDAHDYTDGKSSKNNRFIIKVYPGTYNDWGVRYAGADDEVDDTYLGIRVNDYVYFESTDIEHPENYILVWDGHDGFSENYTMNETQAMRRCLFHLDKRPLHTHIKGFTLESKNTRYCIHPETAGTGWGNTWSIENCIFDWSGCPDVTGYSGATVGIGISSGETGLIKNCKWANTGYSGIVGHNNGFAVNQWNAEKPFFVDGAKLIIENCDLNGCSITQDTLKDDIDGFDCLTVKNCRGIGSINITGLQGNATKSNWKIDMVHSEIIDEGDN